MILLGPFYDLGEDLVVRVKESNSRHLAWNSLVEWWLASAKANLVRVGHYKLRIVENLIVL